MFFSLHTEKNDTASYIDAAGKNREGSPNITAS
jgi:hypothetical protein